MGHRHGWPHRGRIEVNIPGLTGMGGPGWSGFGPFHFEFGDDGPRGGGRHERGRKRMFESGQLRLVLLKLIVDQPRHGYDLIRAIEEMTEGHYAPSPGVVYPTLTLLQDMGLIEEAEGEGPRKPFKATAEGEAHLEENRDEVDALFERLESHGHRRRRGNRPEIGRAVQNLMAAMRNRVMREGWNESLLDDVTEILDDAAKRIERLK